MGYKKTILFLLILFLFSSCVFMNPCESTYYPSDSFPKKWKRDTCLILNMNISTLEENYCKTKDTLLFDETIKLIDSVLAICPYKAGLVETKFKMYIVQGNYQESVIDWFSNLDSSYFATDFEKIFYVNTLQSLLFNNKGDTINRDRVNKAIAVFIEEHIFCCPSDSNWLKNFIQYDKKMFTTYCYVRGRYDNINLLSKELNSCCMDSMEIKNCKQSIDEILITLNRMKQKQYHFEFE